MKFIDKLSLTIFSVIILIISLVTCVIMTGLIGLDLIGEFIVSILTSSVGGPITLAIAIILALLALKCIFFNSYSKEKSKEGILLENENGKLLVSKDTIENLATTVIKNFESVENSTTRVDVDSENKISIFITLSVSSEAVIKDLAAKIQEDVKNAIRTSIDLEIKEVNVRIKNINVKKEAPIKE